MTDLQAVALRRTRNTAPFLCQSSSHGGSEWQDVMVTVVERVMVEVATADATGGCSCRRLVRASWG